MVLLIGLTETTVCRKLLLYVREDMSFKFMKVKSECNFESICVDIKLEFVSSSYNPNKSFISNDLKCLNRMIDEYSKIYQNVLFLGDFNYSISEKCAAEFLNLNGLTSLIKKPICFMNPEKPTIIALILTNQSSCFQHSKVFEAGPSGFHLLTGTEFKMSFQKLQTKILNYKEYKNFDKSSNTTDLHRFKKTVFCIFHKHAPIKRKYIRANGALSMTKDLHKANYEKIRTKN